MQRKTMFYVFAALLMLAIAVAPVAAAGNAQFVNLVEKDGAWNPVPDGASGKMMYKYNPNLMFVFNAEGVVPDTAYTLINYNDNAWGGAEVILGSGVSDEFGVIHIKGAFSEELEFTTYTSGEYSGSGAKVWLVPTSAMVGTQLNAWTPSAFLFETSLIPEPV
jgi:hypothetical protein